MTENIYKNMGISDALYNYASEVLQELEPRFAEIDKMAEINQMKVLAAMQKNQVSEACLLGTSGYGYSDIGRDTLERVYADVFHTEDALVRPRLPAEPMPLHWR